MIILSYNNPAVLNCDQRAKSKCLRLSTQLHVKYTSVFAICEMAIDANIPGGLKVASFLH